MNDEVAVDALAGLLDGPRARGAFLLRAILDAPWGIRIEDEVPLTVVAVARGWAWVLRESEEPRRLAPGDVAVFRGPDHYTLADDPQTPPNVVVYPGQNCTSAEDGRGLAREWDLGVRTWGTSPDGGTAMLIGNYEHAGEISRPLLSALPPVLVLSHDEWDSPLLGMLAEEITKDHPGQRVVLDRLLDLLLIAILRTWFDRPGGGAPAWYQALGDPVVGTALRLVHSQPAQPWTVESLAARSGSSRAVLARRFADMVGEPPMSYLTHWRLALAADLLHKRDVTLTAVARQVGYSDGFALSTAFKRVRGISPEQYRSEPRDRVGVSARREQGPGWRGG